MIPYDHFWGFSGCSRTYILLHTCNRLLFFSKSPSLMFCLTSDVKLYMLIWLPIRIVCLLSQSVIVAFFSKHFQWCELNLLLTKFAQNCPGRMLALGLFCTYLAVLDLYRQDLRPVFSQQVPCTWLIKSF